MSKLGKKFRDEEHIPECVSSAPSTTSADSETMKLATVGAIVLLLFLNTVVECGSKCSTVLRFARPSLFTNCLAQTRLQTRQVRSVSKPQTSTFIDVHQLTPESHTRWEWW